MNNQTELTVITFEGEHESRGVRELVNRTIDVETLHRQLANFIQKLEDIVSFENLRSNTFRLEEVEFSAEISAEGEFKLLGVGGTAAASGSIKFTMRRNPEKGVNFKNK